MRKDFVVYAHYTEDTNELFYIGEGIPKRPYDKYNRNRYWHFKVEKHGFRVEILFSGLLKEEAENIETELILRHKKEGVNLVNFCIGPMYKSHWLTNAPKESHPMFGTKNPEQSKRMIEWNKEHSGEKSPTFGLKRPDLSARNKSGIFNRVTKKVQCIETDEIFNSIKEAAGGKPSGHFARAIRKGHKFQGFHWRYLTSEVIEAEVEQNTAAV